MPGFRRRGTRTPDGGARAVLDAAVTALRQCQRSGITAVPVADVLGLLGAGAESAAIEAPARDPLADPITGCRSVSAG